MSIIFKWRLFSCFPSSKISVHNLYWCSGRSVPFFFQMIEACGEADTLHSSTVSRPIVWPIRLTVSRTSGGTILNKESRQKIVVRIYQPFSITLFVFFHLNVTYCLSNQKLYHIQMLLNIENSTEQSYERSSE